jgi:hypothetical protein
MPPYNCTRSTVELGSLGENEVTTQLGVIDHTARQGGFDGSASAKLIGPIPQIAMTAG